MKIFISSVQQAFAVERKALADYLSGDPLLAELRYLTRHIERLGTGTRDMTRRCVDAAVLILSKK